LPIYHGRWRAVVTDHVELPADVVVACAGIWGPRIGRLVGLPTPLSTALQPLAHQYVRTAPLPALAAIAAPDDLEAGRPILRHQDRDLYFREHGARMGIGAYGHRPMPIEPDEIRAPSEADAAGPAVLPFTPDGFAVA